MTLRVSTRTERGVEPLRPVLMLQASGAQQVTPVLGSQIPGLVEAADVAVGEDHHRCLEPLCNEHLLFVVVSPLPQLAQGPDYLRRDLGPGEVSQDPLPQPRRDIRHHLIMSQPAGDRGAITVFAVLLLTMLLLAAGLVVDGGAKLTAARQAAALAEEAARVGAEQVNVKHAYVDGGSLVADPAAAATAARSYLASAGHPGTVTITGPDAITVSVTITTPTIILSLIGIGSVTGHGTATAYLSQGVESGSPP
jgi:Putative Flp pilus-assembly TadE/G-like